MILGFDMTPEAALCKLAYVLSKKDWDRETKRQMMLTNLRGELTAGRPPSLQDLDLVEAVARSLRLSSTAELQELGTILFPAMLNAAVLARDTVKLESLKGYVSKHTQAAFRASAVQMLLQLDIPINARAYVSGRRYLAEER